MSDPLLGKRVRIDGLTAKPEFNGAQGVAVSFDAAKGRYNVRMMGSGEMIALKQSNLISVEAKIQHAQAAREREAWLPAGVSPNAALVFGLCVLYFGYTVLGALRLAYALGCGTLVLFVGTWRLLPSG